MYKFQQTTPNWLFHQANLNFPKLSDIQKELLKLLVYTKNQTLVPYTSTFVDVPAQTVLERCPLLLEQLKNLNLLDKFFTMGFISVDADHIFPPHIDGDVTDIALNIPLLGCEGTYTVWYDGKITDNELPSYAIGSEIVKIARVCDPRSAVEIDRCDSSIPHWINVNVFHRPETHHNQFRVAASLRFIPDPINEHGELWPHLIRSS